LCSQSLTTIDDEQHDICFIHSLQSLSGHGMQDTGFDHRFKTTGIHHQIGFEAQPAMTIVPVTREPGDIGHNRITTAGQTVE